MGCYKDVEGRKGHMEGDKEGGEKLKLAKLGEKVHLPVAHSRSVGMG